MWPYYGCPFAVVRNLYSESSGRPDERDLALRILLCTIDLHGYDVAYHAALSALGHDVKTYTGLRRYELRTRARRIATVRLPNVLGANRDREWGERRSFREFVRNQDLKSSLVLFVNGHQLATSELLSDIRRAGGRSGLWLLDAPSTLPTVDLDYPEFDFLASFDPHDARSLLTSSGRPCSYVPQGFDDTLRISAPLRECDPSLLFIASPGGRRQAIVGELIQSGVSLELVGQYWPEVLTESPGVRVVPHDVDRREAAHMYLHARPCLNVHHAATSGVNPRTFEVAGYGGLLVTDNTRVAEFFDPGTEALLWSEVHQIVQHAEHIRADPDWAASVASAGHRRAQEAHGLRKRFGQMFAEWSVGD